jgi:hypothetical protein
MPLTMAGASSRPESASPHPAASKMVSDDAKMNDADENGRKVAGRDGMEAQMMDEGGRVMDLLEGRWMTAYGFGPRARRSPCT